MAELAQTPDQCVIHNRVFLPMVCIQRHNLLCRRKVIVVQVWQFLPSGTSSRLFLFTPNHKSSPGHSMPFWIFGPKGPSKILFSDRFHSLVAESQGVVTGALRGCPLEAQTREVQILVGGQLEAHKVAAGQPR